MRNNYERSQTPLTRAGRTHSQRLVNLSSANDGTLLLVPVEAPVLSEIKGIARLEIHPGKLQEFKDLQAQCMAVVRDKDTGTLQYEIFFNDDSSECIAYERYRDSDALLQHLANLGALTTAIFQVCSGSGEILGPASPQLRKALEGSPVGIYTPHQSV